MAFLGVVRANQGRRLTDDLASILLTPTREATCPTPPHGMAVHGYTSPISVLRDESVSCGPRLALPYGYGGPRAFLRVCTVAVSTEGSRATATTRGRLVVLPAVLGGQLPSLFSVALLFRNLPR
jgi:hypothetical protein